MSPRQEITKLITLTIKEFSEFKSDDVRTALLNLIESLDTDLETLEYGPSDDASDKMALLFAANGDAREEAEELEPLVPASAKVVAEVTEEDEEDDETDLEPEDLEEDDLEDDDEDEPLKVW